jgi:CubicO group peptidase (beta-lactamase class C family)
MNGLTFASLVLIGLSATSACAQNLPQVDEIAGHYVGDTTPGLAVLVTKDGKIVHIKGYGLAEIDSQTLVTENTAFDLASVSKQMTAMAAMMLIEDGVLSLDMPVADILPAFEGQDARYRPITIGDLVHHVSGLPDYLDDAEGLDYGQNTSSNEVVSWLARQELTRAPGMKYDYSNSGYVVLGSVIAAAAGTRDLAEFLEKRIWQKLGMNSTRYVTLDDDGSAPSKVVMGYSGSGGEFARSWEPNVVEGDGNVLTTLTDLAKYENALATNVLLDKSATARLFEAGLSDKGKPVTDGKNGPSYGFGWELETAEGDDYASHTGSWMGTSAYYQRNLTSGVSVIVLSNDEDLSAAEVGTEIEAALE